MPAGRASGFTMADCRFTIETEVFAYFAVSIRVYPRQFAVKFGSGVSEIGDGE